ncbi:MAG: glycosyltransferase family 9 protein [Proteobacteria bacterium]|nr:glycosyltransferase family 9 protein [Pseudomonadota bacterium]MCP4920663.1 glycosyltransferase family 9 protein [Pseudomonadota bacterium]
MTTAVVRLSSLGDVVLAASITQALAPVVFVTKPRYHQLVARFPGVERVVGPEESFEADRIVDLQSSPRSRAICRRVSGRVDRVEMHRFSRWTRVAFKTPDRIERVVDRYARAAGVEVTPKPWLPPPTTPGDWIGLVPGAAHALKVWPGWTDLARRLGDRAVVLGTPDQRLEAPVEHVLEEGFDATLEALGRCRVVVGGDTGLVHLAAAMGLPTVALFGPTHSADGFWCHDGVVLERDLACRPCSKHGGDICPIGDHACMDWTVDEVLAAVESA